MGTPSLRCTECCPVNSHLDSSVQHPCLIEILFKPQARTSAGQIKGKTPSQFTVQQPQSDAHPCPQARKEEAQASNSERF